MTDKTTQEFADDQSLWYVGGEITNDFDLGKRRGFKAGYLHCIEACKVKELMEENERLLKSLLEITTLDAIGRRIIYDYHGDLVSTSVNNTINEAINRRKNT